MFNALSQSRSERTASKYACAVHAMAIIACSYRLYNSANDAELRSAYNSLWNYSGTTVYSTSNGISYGGTQPNRIGPALVSYARDKGMNLTSQRIVSPTFSDIQTRIAQGALSGTINGAQTNFLVVADGWYDSATYFNYTSIPRTLQSYEITGWSGSKLFHF
jgi:hypothetical protein